MEAYNLWLIFFMLLVVNLILFFGLGAIAEGLEEIRKRIK